MGLMKLGKGRKGAYISKEEEGRRKARSRTKKSGAGEGVSGRTSMPLSRCKIGQERKGREEKKRK